MTNGKARFIEYKDSHGRPWTSVKYRTRKDRRQLIYGHSSNPGKSNKKFYHRQFRRGKYRLMEIKGSQWKRLHFADLWNWC